MVGSIYLAKIYFTDLSEYKIRPVLVIKELGDDCICLQMTSQVNNNSILFKYIANIKEQKLKAIFKLFCKEIGCDEA